MATTIQFSGNIKVERYATINGERHEVECSSGDLCITKLRSLESLFDIMKSELIQREIIDVDHMGNYYWKENGAYLMADEDYLDD